MDSMINSDDREITDSNDSFDSDATEEVFTPDVLPIIDQENEEFTPGENTLPEPTINEITNDVIEESATILPIKNPEDPEFPVEEIIDDETHFIDYANHEYLISTPDKEEEKNENHSGGIPTNIEVQDPSWEGDTPVVEEQTEVIDFKPKTPSNSSDELPETESDVPLLPVEVTDDFDTQRSEQREFQEPKIGPQKFEEQTDEIPEEKPEVNLSPVDIVTNVEPHDVEAPIFGIPITDEDDFTEGLDFQEREIDVPVEPSYSDSNDRNTNKPETVIEPHYLVPDDRDKLYTEDTEVITDNPQKTNPDSEPITEVPGVVPQIPSVFSSGPSSEVNHYDVHGTNNGVPEHQYEDLPQMAVFSDIPKQELEVPSAPDNDGKNTESETMMDASNEQDSDLEKDEEPSDLVLPPDSGNGMREIGFPDVFSGYWRPQTGPNDCALYAQGGILEADGVPFDSNLLQEQAISDGSFNPDEGTNPSLFGTLLEQNGIEVTRNENSTIQEMATELTQGKGVLVEVDCEPLWGEQGGHALWVIGMEVAEDGLPINVIVNDSGREDGKSIKYPYQDFKDAWASYGNFMVTTQKPLFIKP